MVFSSQTFLFFFLPLAGLCVLIRSKPVQNALLLIASLIFYAWGEPKMVVLMVLVTLVAYGSGFAIVHFEARPRAKKAALIAAIVVILFRSVRELAEKEGAQVLPICAKLKQDIGITAAMQATTAALSPSWAAPKAL